MIIFDIIDIFSCPPVLYKDAREGDATSARAAPAGEARAIRPRSYAAHTPAEYAQVLVCRQHAARSSSPRTLFAEARRVLRTEKALRAVQPADVRGQPVPPNDRPNGTYQEWQQTRLRQAQPARGQRRGPEVIFFDAQPHTECLPQKESQHIATIVYRPPTVTTSPIICLVSTIERYCVAPFTRHQTTRHARLFRNTAAFMLPAGSGGGAMVRGAHAPDGSETRYAIPRLCRRIRTSAAQRRCRRAQAR